MNQNQIVTLKVNRNQAGKLIPYDKIYFFHRDDRDLIPKFFEYAIVLPVEETLLAQIACLVPKETSHHHFKRNDDDLNRSTGVDGRSISKEDLQKWWLEHFVEQYDMANRVAVVPILVAKKRKKSLPKYLTSRRWFTSGQRRAAPKYGYTLVESAPAVHDLAYLSTPLPSPHDKIQPICNMCPRQLLQLNGECTPGMDVCYRSLNFNEILADDEKKELEANASL